ncbi:unnamed protein product [Xylocopa violacea]|uniref:Lysophospholipid acyltransferase 7 n=1 Tax=Xylocopa violacea TaxID=135666 RepID=A0ABP1N1S0_XYLVO
MWTDIAYVVLLILCVFFGFYYNRIDDPDVKKWIGTFFGLALTAIVSGNDTLHPVIFTLINAIIITKISPKKCHLYSFAFSFFDLLIVSRLGNYVGLSVLSTHTNLILMILTLKLSGLAFEINAASNAPPDDVKGENSEALKDIGILDVFHYGFSYMGLLTGPYYRYRTYWDHLYRPFHKYVDPWPLTLFKLKQTGCFIVLFLITNYLYPVKYVLTEDYAQRSLFYRHFYMYLTFAVFRLRMYIGMGLAECACQMAGLGVYPSSSNPVQGLGPRDYKTAVMISQSPEKLKTVEYNFDTVYNMDIARLEKCYDVRTAMKAWNGCVQYWFGVYVYKRFPFKSLRTVVTLTLSAVWHGWSPGYFICICQIPIFMLVNDLIVKYYRRSKENSIAKMIWLALGWYERTTCMAYLGVSFLLLDFGDSLHFYKQIYFSDHIITLLLYIACCCYKPYAPKEAKEIEDKDK